MTYVYGLKKEDLVAMGLTPTASEEYFIEQSGWNGSFCDLIEVVKKNNIDFKGEVIVSGSELTPVQQDYIIKNVKCKEC
jgi:hypothetical protein